MNVIAFASILMERRVDSCWRHVGERQANDSPRVAIRAPVV